MTAPQIVLDLAASVNGGTPLAWHEYDDHWTIVMEDGRKIHFAKNAGAPSKPQHELTVQDHREETTEEKPPRRHPPRRDK